MSDKPTPKIKRKDEVVSDRDLIAIRRAAGLLRSYHPRYPKQVRDAVADFVIDKRETIAA